MTRSNILAMRLQRQHIMASRCTTPAEVVMSLGAMQAQDYLGALWSVGLRLPGSKVESIEQALSAGEIVRTWPMRGTLHFVPAADARWMVKLMAPRVISSGKARDRALGLTEDTYATGLELFREALSGGKQLERSEMMAVLEAQGITTTEQRGYHILWRAAQEALICLGPTHGKQQSFVLLDEWVTKHRDLSHEEALVEIACRYFISHGPATTKDFMRWTKLTAKDTAFALEQLSTELAPVTVEGVEYWMSSDAEPTKMGDQAYLLPGFDEYMLGYSDRSLIVTDEQHRLIVPGKNGMFMPTIIIDGRVAGIWKRVIKRKEVIITLQPFVPLSKADLQRIAQAADRYGEYLGLPALLQAGI